MSFQSRFDARYWMLGAGALGRPRGSTHRNSPGKNTGVGCHAPLQGIFPTQELNPGLPHCRRILYQLSHQGSPITQSSP